MIKLLQRLFGLLQAFGQLLSNRQLIEAGKSEQAKIDAQEVLANEQKAHDAVNIADPDRDDRLRRRFDRSSGQ